MNFRKAKATAEISSLTSQSSTYPMAAPENESIGFFETSTADFANKEVHEREN
jgi:hypothetical protein